MTGSVVLALAAEVLAGVGTRDGMRLREDLQLSPIQILSLVGILEHERSVVLPEGLVGELMTLGDLRYYVETIASHERGP